MRPSLVTAFCAASTSGAAIILYFLGWVTLTYSVIFLAPLTAILLSAALVYSGRGGEQTLTATRIGRQASPC